MSASTRTPVELFNGSVGFWEEEIGDNEELFAKHYFDKLDYLESDAIYILWTAVLCDGEIVLSYETQWVCVSFINASSAFAVDEAARVH